MPDPGVGTYALLPLTLLPIAGYAQLACLIHAANVRSEPGSNPSKVFCFAHRYRSRFFSLTGLQWTTFSRFEVACSAVTQFPQYSARTKPGLLSRSECQPIGDISLP